ncbi:hypothetical protein G7054_g9860 [Neopestalotiopsis clavispora]|nr:hypothetical protein G7054_g9860 [Neopestalotiopsis clavispora]
MEPATDHCTGPAERSTTAIVATTIVSTITFLLFLKWVIDPWRPQILPGPLTTTIPRLTKEELAQVPYQPDHFPGARDVRRRRRPAVGYAPLHDANAPGAGLVPAALDGRRRLHLVGYSLGGGIAVNFAAALLGRDASGAYYPNGEWQLYKYYAAMQGDRAVTSASDDKLFDAFAVRGDSDVKIIAGTRLTANSYDIAVTGLESISLGSSGVVSVRTIHFDWAGATGQIDAPVDLGTADYTYTDGSFTINLTPATNSTAYAYEFSL